MNDLKSTYQDWVESLYEKYDCTVPATVLQDQRKRLFNNRTMIRIFTNFVKKHMAPEMKTFRCVYNTFPFQNFNWDATEKTCAGLQSEKSELFLY